MKKLVVFAVVLAAVVLSAINPFPAHLTVWNKTEDFVYIRLSYHDVQKYFFTVSPEGNTDTYQLSLYEVTRKLYDMQTIACGEVAEGTLDANKNIKLVFTECDQMYSWWKPQYWGEPGMEKPNFYEWKEFDFYYQLFQYEVEE